MNTPWGKADAVTTLTKGLHWVSTPSHGGFLIAKATAHKLLTPEAIKYGATEYGSYYAFEEDCAASIVLLELLNPSLRIDLTPLRFTSVTVESLIAEISYWYLPYLLERGIAPNADGAEAYNNRKEVARLREIKSPNLIITAWGDWHEDCKPGEVRVMTADGKVYFVTNESYHCNRALNLLSDCVLSR